MPTGACGIDCGVCRLHEYGLCSSCGPGDSEEASLKIAAQYKFLGSPCPILECAREKGIKHCLRDCDEFPCDRFHQGPYPFSSGFLTMQERRRDQDATEKSRGKKTIPVDPVHWDDLRSLDPHDVISRCLCQWDSERGYAVPFLGDIYWVHPDGRSIKPDKDDMPLDTHLPLVLVHFLLNAQDRPLQHMMVTEREIPGGDFFFRHLHALPTRPLEETYGTRPEEFMRAGLALGGRRGDVSDTSLQFLALPRIPIGFHLWPADEEFPAKCSITFDASIHLHLPLDIIWALSQVVAGRLRAAAK